MVEINNWEPAAPSVNAQGEFHEEVAGATAHYKDEAEAIIWDCPNCGDPTENWICWACWYSESWGAENDVDYDLYFQREDPPEAEGALIINMKSFTQGLDFFFFKEGSHINPTEAILKIEYNGAILNLRVEYSISVNRTNSSENDTSKIVTNLKVKNKPSIDRNKALDIARSVLNSRHNPHISS